MHLLPSYWTTTNTKKRKKGKKSKALLLAEKEHKKFLKSMGVNRSVAQPGSASALGAEGQRFKSFHSDQNAGIAQLVERGTCNSQVVGSTPTSGTIFYHPTMSKKEEMIYTGDEIIGIAQMHKSNAVPIRGKKQATEVAKMRRG